MFKLGAPESGWKEILPGVRVRFAPIGIKSVRAAREAAGLALREDADDHQEALDALSREFLRRGIVEWEGIGDAEGEPIAVTPESIELFIDNPDTFEAAYLHYVTPWLARDREKNVSAASSNGTSKAVTAVVDTATSPAKRPRGGGVKSVRTGSTNRTPKRANSSSK